MAFFYEWLDLHALDSDLVGNCIAALGLRHFDLDLASPVPPASCVDAVIFSTLRQALNHAIRPAFTEFFSNVQIGRLIDTIRWHANDINAPPHVIDHGATGGPEIRMSWTGSACDLMWLAHEVAHALQLLLSPA